MWFMRHFSNKLINIAWPRGKYGDRHIYGGSHCPLVPPTLVAPLHEEEIQTRLTADCNRLISYIQEKKDTESIL